MVGEALIDIVIPVTGQVAEHVGGSPANVAIGLARLDHSTRLATWIAPDPRGQRIAALLQEEGVALVPGSTGAARTPTATAHLDAAGVASYDFQLDWQLPAATSAQPGEHLHVGSFSVTLEPGGSDVRDLVRAARASSTVSYDPNARPSIMGAPGDVLPLVEEVIAASDVVKASDQDIAWLYGPQADPAQVLRGWLVSGPRVAMCTLGPAGVLVACGAQVEQFAPGDAVVVDTVGAGDSFMSGILSGLLDAGYLGGADARARLATATMEDLRPLVDRATACADITVSRAGANPPRRAELPA